MSSHRFLRLEEVESKTGLTQWDVLGAIESGKLNFCAQVELGNVGALYKSEFVVSVFDYMGMVKLFKPLSKRFALSMESHGCRCFVVMEPQNIKRWRSVGDAFGEMTQKNVKFIDKAVTLPQFQFYAYASVGSLPTVENVVGTLTNMIAECMPQKDMTKLKAQYPWADTQSLHAFTIKIKPEQLRIDKNDLDRVFSLSQPLTSDINVSDHILTHPIEQIVHRVLLDNPQFNADKVWALLRKELNQDGERRYDVDGVIDVMTLDEIQWFGRGVDSDNRMTYGSFRKNTVYNVKRYLKREKT